jgi:quercetin dioxygenase-like cupin family protein
MELIDLLGHVSFAEEEHVQTFLAETPLCSISVVGWEPGQTGPIHCHPGADEIYHLLAGEGIFTTADGDVRLGAGATVIFRAGELHQAGSLTRMVLYRVQSGADRHPEFFDAWPAA